MEAKCVYVLWSLLPYDTCSLKMNKNDSLRSIENSATEPEFERFLLLLLLLLRTGSPCTKLQGHIGGRTSKSSSITKCGTAVTASAKLGGR